MASSRKTPRLGLSLWEETDCPERLDFVQDNQKMESLLGAHIRDTALHLTADEKNYLHTPLYTVSYLGNDRATRSLYSPFTPRLVLVVQIGGPPVSFNNGVMETNMAIGCGSKGSQGITIEGEMVTVVQQSAAEVQDGCRLCLNQMGKTYTMVMIR